MKQETAGLHQVLGQRLVGAACAFGNGVRKGMIRSVAIVTMLMLYVVSSVGAMAPAALGVVGVSGLALTTSATPADAHWRRRRRRRRWYRGGYYPYYYGGYRHRRRRRRRRGVGIYLRL